MSSAKLDKIRNRIGSFPDFPKKGIMFRDIFPLFQQPTLLPDVVDLLLEQIKALKVDVVVGIDSRGFLFGPAMSVKIGCSFVPARKRGKLPGETIFQSYSLEYGEDCVEIQKGSIKDGDKVVIVDDLIATGGTMSAVYNLVKQTGADVVCCLCVIEMKDLEGWSKLPKGANGRSLIQYEGE